MSFSDELDFAIDTVKTKGYDQFHNLKSIPYEEFINILRSDISENKELSSHITTKLNKSDSNFFNNSLYLAVLDCDSKQEYELSRDDLKHRNINHCPIISSYKNSEGSEHYWIICDKIGNFSETIKFMKSIAGCDSRFVSCCDRKKNINLRAYPKHISIPVWIEGLPVLNQDMLFNRWVHCFYNYWYSTGMTVTLRQMVLKSNNSGSYLDIGRHLPKDIQNKLRFMYGDVMADKILVNNNLYGMEYDLQEI